MKARTGFLSWLCERDDTGRMRFCGAADMSWLRRERCLHGRAGGFGERFGVAAGSAAVGGGEGAEGLDRDGQMVCRGAVAVCAGDLAAHEQDAGIAGRAPYGVALCLVGQEQLAVGQFGEW